MLGEVARGLALGAWNPMNSIIDIDGQGRREPLDNRSKEVSTSKITKQSGVCEACLNIDIHSCLLVGHFALADEFTRANNWSAPHITLATTASSCLPHNIPLQVHCANMRFGT